jgi:hypothetical protein
MKGADLRGRNNRRLIIAKNRWAENALLASQSPPRIAADPPPPEDYFQHWPIPCNGTPEVNLSLVRAITTELKISSPCILKDLRDGMPLA